MSDSKMHGPVPGTVVRGGEAKNEEVFPPREVKVEIRLNGVSLVSIPASPDRLKELAAGLVFSGGMIEKAEEIVSLEARGNRVDLEIKNPPVITPEDRRGWSRETGSGCGGGLLFSGPALYSRIAPIRGDFHVSAGAVRAGAEDLFRRGGPEGENGRGLHHSFLRDGEETLSRARDIARHNTVDKIIGDCLLRGIGFSGKILYTSGRISSEMVVKSARAGIPVLASLHTPTDIAVDLAREWGVTILGYVRASSFTIFSHPERIRIENK